MIRRLEKEELLDVILRNIEAGGWSHSVLRHDALPFKISITSGTEIQDLTIYIWNISHGGRGRSADEYRIQLKPPSPLSTGTDFKTLLLGWFEREKVFVAFDAYKHRNFGGLSPSVQVPKHTVEVAVRNKVAFHTKELRRVEGREVVVAFQQTYLIQYVNDVYPEYHAPSSQGISEEEADIIEKNRLDLPVPDSELAKLPTKRRTAIVTMNVKVREGSFQRNVWRLYNGKCVICGLQAGVTEAAHIISVERKGTDEIINGVELCRNHHKAYDDGLFGIDPNYMVILNQTHVEKLKRIGLDGGLDEFIRTLKIGETITLPSDNRFNPKKEYLAENCPFWTTLNGDPKLDRTTLDNRNTKLV